jgi:hypothetical protein
MKVAPSFSPDIAIQSVVDRQSSLGGYRLSGSINELDGNNRKKLLAPNNTMTFGTFLIHHQKGVSSLLIKFLILYNIIVRPAESNRLLELLYRFSPSAMRAIQKKAMTTICGYRSDSICDGTQTLPRSSTRILVDPQAN